MSLMIKMILDDAKDKDEMRVNVNGLETSDFSPMDAEKLLSYGSATLVDKISALVEKSIADQGYAKPNLKLENRNIFMDKLDDTWKEADKEEVQEDYKS